jgi:DNA-binding CsgD family transcriptional regulator
MAKPVRFISSPTDLTPHERRLCIFIMQGFSSEEIGGKIGRTSSAVEVYIHRLMRTIGTRNRAHLVAWYLQYPLAVVNLTHVTNNHSHSLTVQ